METIRLPPERTTLREIKRQSPASIVLMMSAYHVVDRAVEAMKLGAHDYLTKPFDFDELLARIDHVCAKRAGAERSLAYRLQILALPEVATVVSKTGRAEISEDPMGPEQTDVFIMLKPRWQWATGRDKGQLVEAIQQDLAELPGLRFSFSQPIALRVNELISGVKSDVAI